MPSPDRVAAIKERLQELTGGARSGGTKEMARLVAEDFHNVNRWVRGGAAPPHDFLLQVANVYGVSLDWLYGRPESERTYENPEEPAWARRLDARLRFLERQVAALMPEERVLHLVDGVEQRVTEAIRGSVTAEEVVDRFVDQMLADPRVRARLRGEPVVPAGTGSGEG